jgi:hypothetical protein
MRKKIALSENVPVSLQLADRSLRVPRIRMIPFCRETLFGHCFEAGGSHLESEHVALMSDCIAIRQIAADFLIRGSVRHARTCGLCAEVCHLCALSCRKIGDLPMDRCADACEQCASVCGDMAHQSADTDQLKFRYRTCRAHGDQTTAAAVCRNSTLNLHKPVLITFFRIGTPTTRR